MQDLMRVADIAAYTGFSARFWQRKVATGVVPGVSKVQTGQRVIYLIDPAQFVPWWQQQLQPVKPCESPISPAISTGAATRSTTASRRKAKTTSGLSKQAILQKLRAGLTSSSAS